MSIMTIALSFMSEGSPAGDTCYPPALKIAINFVHIAACTSAQRAVALAVVRPYAPVKRDGGLRFIAVPFRHKFHKEEIKLLPAYLILTLVRQDQLFIVELVKRYPALASTVYSNKDGDFKLSSGGLAACKR